MKITNFHKQIVKELIHDVNGLILTAKGIGLDKVLASILSVFSTEKSLILILNLTIPEYFYFNSILDSFNY